MGLFTRVHSSSFSIGGLQRHSKHKSVETDSGKPSLCRGKHRWRSLNVHSGEVLVGIFFWAVNRIRGMPNMELGLIDHPNREDWLLNQEKMLGSFFER